MICWLLLVPAGVPVLVSFSLFFLSSGKGFCSIMICWFLLVSAGFPSLSPFFSFLWFRCLSPFFSLLSFFRTGVLFHHDLLLVPAGVPVFVSLLWFRCLSPFSYLLSILRKGVLFHQDFLVPPGSGWGPGACLPSSLSFLFSGKGFCFIINFLVPLRFGGFRCLSPFFSLFPQQRKLMGSSAKNSSGVNWCRRRVRFNEVPEKVLGGLGARPGQVQ